MKPSDFIEVKKTLNKNISKYIDLYKKTPDLQDSFAAKSLLDLKKSLLKKKIYIAGNLEYHNGTLEL